MALMKKKIIQIFSDGSVGFNNTVIKKLKKSKMLTKDHANFNLYKKNLTIVTKQTNINSFKTKYFRF